MPHWSTYNFKGCVKRNRIRIPLGHHNPTSLRIHLCDFLFQLGQSAGCEWERVGAPVGIQGMSIVMFFGLYCLSYIPDVVV